MVDETLPALEEIEQVDRPRGILTEQDRQFLLDKSYREDLEPQSQRNVRSRLRTRLRHAILDCYLIDEYLEDRDRKRVFSDIDSAFLEGLHGICALLYRGANQDISRLESWFEGGLTHVELEAYDRLLVERPTVDIDIESAETVKPETVDEKLSAGNFEDLTEAELRYVLWKVGELFGSRSSDNDIFRALAEYVDRFEEQTRITAAREQLGEDQTPDSE